MQTTLVVFVALAVLNPLWNAVSIFALFRRRRPPALRIAEPITLLKPLRGIDRGLEANLRSHFEQDYPTFEIVFGVEGATDPVLPLIERLVAEYPQVRSRIVVHDQGKALNPKVRNLLAMLSADVHDVVAISDSNIRVPRDYLTTSLASLQQPNTGLVTHPIAAIGGHSLGAGIERAYLNSNVVAGIATAIEVLQHAAVVGKSMMFRRSLLDRLGGLDSLANVLAEDYVMGRMIQHGGYKVVLADAAVTNICSDGTIKATTDRMVRWSMLRARVQPLAYLLEPLSSPLVILGLSFWVAGMHLGPAIWLSAWSSLLMVLRDWAAARRVGHALTLRDILLGPARELTWLTAWLLALGRKHVAWRGRRLRVSAGTRLYQLPERRAHR